MTSFKARVLYDFTALDDDQLTITRGQILTIVDAEPDLNGWALAENGQRDGYVPIEYVQAIGRGTNVNVTSNSKQIPTSYPSTNTHSNTNTSTMHSVPTSTTRTPSKLPSMLNHDTAPALDSLPPKVAIPSFQDPDLPALTATSSATSSSTPSLRSPASNSSDARSKGSGTTVTSHSGTMASMGSNDRGLISLLETSNHNNTSNVAVPNVFADHSHSACHIQRGREYRRNGGHSQQTTPFMANRHYGGTRGVSHSVSDQRFDPMLTNGYTPNSNTNTNNNTNTNTNVINKSYDTGSGSGSGSGSASGSGLNGYCNSNDISSTLPPLTNGSGFYAPNTATTTNHVQSGSNSNYTLSNHAHSHSVNSVHSQHSNVNVAAHGHGHTPTHSHTQHGHNAVHTQPAMPMHGHGTGGCHDTVQCSCCADPSCMDCSASCNAVHYDTTTGVTTSGYNTVSTGYNATGYNTTSGGPHAVHYNNHCNLPSRSGPTPPPMTSTSSFMPSIAAPAF